MACRINAGESGLQVSVGRQGDAFTWEGQLAQGQELEIRGVNGSVTASAASGNRPRVTASRRGLFDDPNAVRIEVVEHDGGVTICAVYPSDRKEPYVCGPGDQARLGARHSGVKVAFDVELPPGVRLNARTVNGSVRAESLQSDVQVATVNGSVYIGTTGHAQAHTVNGSIEATMGSEGWPRETAFETVNGSVTIRMPRDASADIEVRTTNGGISSDLPIVVKDASRRRLEGTLGSGGRRLLVKTVNGAVSLEPTN
jgi:hypothetical protein